MVKLNNYDMRRSALELKISIVDVINSVNEEE
jgi:hypothetical protein